MGSANCHTVFEDFSPAFDLNCFVQFGLGTYLLFLLIYWLQNKELPISKLTNKVRSKA